MCCWVLWICLFPQTRKSTYIQDILQGHQASWESWLCWKHQLCFYYRSQVNIFPQMPCITNAAKILTTVHKRIRYPDLGMNSEGARSIFRSHLKQRWQNASMNFKQSLELSFLLKLTKSSSPKFFQLFIQLVSWSTETDRNERKSKKQNPNIWLLKNFLACWLGEENISIDSKLTFGENGFWLQLIWNKGKH